MRQPLSSLGGTRAVSAIVVVDARCGDRRVCRWRRVAGNILAQNIRCKSWSDRQVQGPFVMDSTTDPDQDEVFDLSPQEREDYFKRSSRRWPSAGRWQYRLSTLFFITALLAAMLGAARIWYDQHEQEHLVRRMGGQPYSDETGILSFDLRRVYFADFSGTSITDGDLPALQHLPDLEELNLVDTAITDQGLEHLYNLPSLRRVDLTKTRVSPEAIARLRVKRPRLTFGPVEKRSVFVW